MKKIKKASGQQLSLFSQEEVSSWKPIRNPLSLPDSGEMRRSDQMEKFKPLLEPTKPMIEMSIESRLAEIEERIAPNHLCRMVKEVVFSIDTSGIESKYSFDGQKSYHPKLLLSVLFYGYSTGVRSSRKLEEKCMSDDIYKYLMQYHMPDHRTLSDFRKNNIEELNGLFLSVLRIFEKLGYKKVGKIYIDGTKLKANASIKRTKTREGFEEWLKVIKKEIKGIIKEVEEIDQKEEDLSKQSEEEKALLEKLRNREYQKEQICWALRQMEREDKHKMNLTDPTAENMKSGGSKDIRPGYNCQAGSTEEGIITVAEVVTEANDRNQLKPILEQSELNTGKKVDEVTADSGYGSYESYEYLEKNSINGYVPDQYFKQYKSGEYKKEGNRYHYTNFEYDENTDSYTCPEGKRLEYYKARRKKTGSRNWNHKVYKGKECPNCAQRASCTKSKRRELLIDIREPLLKRMREKLMEKEGQLKYLMRQYIIEPIFGHLKYNLGYRHFLLRGIKKVNGEFKLMCIGWNIRKMLSLGYKPEMVRML